MTLSLRDPRTLRVRTLIPQEMLPPGLWVPEVDMGDRVLSRPRALTAIGDQLEFELLIPMVDADHFEPAADLAVIPSVSARGLELALASVVPHFMGSQGQATWFLPCAQVTLALGSDPLAFSLQPRAGGWWAGTADELYGARLISGPRLTLVEDQGAQFASVDWSQPELARLAQHARAWRASIQQRLGPMRPLRLVLVGRMNERGTSLPGNATRTTISLRLHHSPLIDDARYGLPTLHELVHFALPDGLDRGVTEALAEFISLRVATAERPDSLLSVLSHRWDMRRPERPEQSLAVERYYGGPVLVLCDQGPLDVEALVAGSPVLDGQKIPSPALRRVEAHLAERLPWSRRLPDDYLDRCFEAMGARRGPPREVVSDAYLGRALGAPLTTNPANERGVLIGTVSAAGFEAGDLLLRVEGEPVDDFERLVESLARHLALPKVRVQILRRGSVVETSVTLPAPRPGETGVASYVRWEWPR